MLPPGIVLACVPSREDPRDAFIALRAGTLMELPQGAQEVSGEAEMVKAVREQAALGADWIKLYADYRTGRARVLERRKPVQ